VPAFKINTTTFPNLFTEEKNHLCCAFVVFLKCLHFTQLYYFFLFFLTHFIYSFLALFAYTQHFFSQSKNGHKQQQQNSSNQRRRNKNILLKMGEQQFFLKWNDFQNNMVSSFKHLRDEKSFTDVS
jgi:hypothetical protein